MGYRWHADHDSALVVARSGQYDDFRKLLRAARRAAGLTQAQVAKRLGKPQSFVSKCESGERRVDVVELAQLARVYGVPLSFFTGESLAVAEPKPRYGRRSRTVGRKPR